MRLAPADLGGGVDAAVEALVEAGEAEGEAHLLVGAAGGDAGPHAAAVQLVQGADDVGSLDEAGHHDGGGAGVALERLGERGLEIVRAIERVLINIHHGDRDGAFR